MFKYLSKIFSKIYKNKVCETLGLVNNICTDKTGN